MKSQIVQIRGQSLMVASKTLSLSLSLVTMTHQYDSSRMGFGGQYNPLSFFFLFF